MSMNESTVRRHAVHGRSSMFSPRVAPLLGQSAASPALRMIDGLENEKSMGIHMQETVRFRTNGAAARAL
jgi:hypothetical protein